MTDHKAEWVLVPRVATEAMVTAARGFSVPGYCVAAEQWPTIYAAMLAASPAPDDFQAAADDLVIYGTAIMRDGKRIDPRTVEIAPAASEGEDGAVALLEALLAHIDAETCTHEETHRGGAIWTICDGCGRQWADDRGGFKPHEDAPAVAAARAFLERPAAQVAATPKHDEGREAMVDRVMRATFKGAPITDCLTGGGDEEVAIIGAILDAARATQPAPKHDEGRAELALADEWERRCNTPECDPLYRMGNRVCADELRSLYNGRPFGAAKAALATQPAARRVTDGPDWRGLYRTQTAMRYMGASPQLSLADAQRMADEDIQRLESFAQPAEGVSRSDRDFPGDAEHENGDYENRCVQCGEVFTGYKRRVVCRVCADKLNNEATP